MLSVPHTLLKMTNLRIQVFGLPAIYRVSEKDRTFFKTFSLGPRCDIRILCPRERRVFQSKLGVSSSNQCNLHHSPHTGHLGKKINKGTIFFGHPVQQSLYSSGYIVMLPHKAAEIGHDDRTELPHLPYSLFVFHFPVTSVVRAI
jgi:hypothetical protein